MTPEGAFKIELKKSMDIAHGFWYYITADSIKRGIPDMIGTYACVFFGIEVKAGTHPSDMQIITLAKIKATQQVDVDCIGVLEKVTKNDIRWHASTKGLSLAPSINFGHVDLFVHYLMEQCSAY